MSLCVGLLWVVTQIKPELALVYLLLQSNTGHLMGRNDLTLCREGEREREAHEDPGYLFSLFHLFFCGLEADLLHHSLNCSNAFASKFIQNSVC